MTKDEQQAIINRDIESRYVRRPRRECIAPLGVPDEPTIIGDRRAAFIQQEPKRV